eukprot:3473861-Prymnesium_polylepis.1
MVATIPPPRMLLVIEKERDFADPTHAARAGHAHTATAYLLSSLRFKAVAPSRSSSTSTARDERINQAANRPNISSGDLTSPGGDKQYDSLHYRLTRLMFGHRT